MANLPAYAAVTPPVITLLKRPRFLPPSDTPPVEQSVVQPLEYRLGAMSHTFVTFQPDSNIRPSQTKGPIESATSTKRKIEEHVKLPPVPFSTTANSET